MSVKPINRDEYGEIRYSNPRWKQLKKLRAKAIWLMTSLEKSHLYSLTHGSIVRGDVKQGSDIDIFIPEVQNSFLVETALEKAEIPINSRFVVQATPFYAMKAHIEVDELATVSFPLMAMRRVEREFYKFGGEANLGQLDANERVVGVDKRLMLIQPSENGHVESSVIGREEFVAKILGISVETVLDRVRALSKRNNVGRTGVFIKRELMQDETFELVLKRLSGLNPAVRRRMKN